MAAVTASGNLESLMTLNIQSRLKASQGLYSLRLLVAILLFWEWTAPAGAFVVIISRSLSKFAGQGRVL